ncbi:MAG: hypothetical protein GC196_02625 [Hyphomonas sp.]|nr:hypothetical protein [Hyphomonas sp.]
MPVIQYGDSGAHAAGVVPSDGPSENRFAAIPMGGETAITHDWLVAAQHGGSGARAEHGRDVMLQRF